MTNGSDAARKRIRFLFVGDPRYDRRIRNLISTFLSHGWQVELFYCSYLNSTLAIEGVAKMVHVKPATRGGALFFLSYDRRLRAAIRREGPCPVTMACDLFGMRAAATLKSPGSILIYDAREVYTQLPAVEGRRFRQAYWRKWERHGLDHTDVLVTTALLDADVIRSVHGELPHTVVVKNMPSKEAAVTTTKSLRTELAIPPNKKILVYVGGLQRGRGLAAALQAMQQIDDAVLVLIGRGAFTDELRSICATMGIADRVLFYGPADASDVLSLLSSADVGLSLIERTSGSYRLALPSKVFEYLHAGLPVVSSPLEQVRLCLGDNPAIFYADESNVAEIVSAIGDALRYSQPSGVRELISADARSRFTFEHDAEELLQEIERRIPG